MLRPCPDDGAPDAGHLRSVSTPVSPFELVRVDEMLWEIPADARADMRVPARAFAYKDVERVVEVVEHARLARRVVRLVPIGVVKG